MPALPEGAPTQSFQFKREVFQRGLSENGRTTRAPRLLNHVYTIDCLVEFNGVSDRQRFAQARRMIDETQPLVYENMIGEGYQRSFQLSRVNRVIVEPTGCQTRGVAFEVITTDPTRILRWAVDNGVLSEAMGQRG